MWGGWYDDPTLMVEMEQFKKLVSEYTVNDLPKTNSEVVLVIDETYNRRVGKADPMYYSQGKFRIAMSNLGIPYDIMLAEDFEHCKDYKAVILPYPLEYLSDTAKELIQFCKANNLTVLTATLEDMTDIDADKMRQRLIDAGVHCYCDSGDVIYHGNGVLCIHSATAGHKTINLPKICDITPLSGSVAPFTSNKIELDMNKFETILFKIN